MPKLNIRQQKFVLEYVKDQNATQAAIRAGYSAKTAQAIGSENLTKPMIAAEIQARIGKVLDKLEVSVERVLKERARLAFFDPRKFFDADGNLIPIHQLDDDSAAVVAGMEIDTVGPKDKPIVRTAKIKLSDKDKSLTALEKHLGMYSDDDKGSSPLNIIINLG